MYKFIPQSSLYKPFCDAVPETEYKGGSMLKNGTLSFQFISLPPEERRDAVDAFITVDSPLPYAAYEVKNVAVMRPCYPATDEYYCRKEPGLYPDPLVPIPENNRIRLLKDAATSIWITINPEKAVLEAGEYTVKVTQRIGENSVTSEVTVKVIDALLPEQSLIYTNWFHCDCLCDRYGCEMFSDRHFELIEKYARMAVLGGMNMILTPCFTPPLDTNVGAERMTAQLIDVTVTDDGYEFGFDKLRRFLEICERVGIRYYEHSHLFSQWGSEHCPKVMANTKNGYERIFGWETDATKKDGEYAKFLSRYLPALKAVLEEMGIGNRLYFHISDEPGIKHLETYTAAKNLVEPYTEGYHIFDALSSYEFYKTGAVEVPVPTTTHAAEFLPVVPKGIRWVYYTGGACYGGYSNRLIAMPNSRNRMLGAQMWYHDIDGFLQWAYNFWYTRNSEAEFDPWSEPDAAMYFVGGTSYMVYPAKNGPVPSMRYYSFAEGIEDYMALKLYESLAGREAAEKLLFESFGGMRERLDEKGTMFTYCPSDDAEMLNFRERLNEAIGAAI